jgi:hypothetical protein
MIFDLLDSFPGVCMRTHVYSFVYTRERVFFVPILVRVIGPRFVILLSLLLCVSRTSLGKHRSDGPVRVMRIIDQDVEDVQQQHFRDVSSARPTTRRHSTSRT